MAFVMGNLVLEQSNAPGVGDFVVQGQVAGRQTFAGAIGNGNSTYYWAVQNDGQFEQGEATVQVGASVRVTRDKVAFNSNGTTDKMDFTGLVTVYVEIPAERIPYQRPDGSLNLLGTAATKDLAANGGTIPETDRTNDFSQSQIVANAQFWSGRTAGGVIQRLVGVTTGDDTQFRTAGSYAWRDSANLKNLVTLDDNANFMLDGERIARVLQTSQMNEAATWGPATILTNLSSLFSVTPKSTKSLLLVFCRALMRVDDSNGIGAFGQCGLYWFDGSNWNVVDTETDLFGINVNGSGATSAQHRSLVTLVGKFDRTKLNSGNWQIRLRGSAASGDEIQSNQKQFHALEIDV